MSEFHFLEKHIGSSPFKPALEGLGIVTNFPRVKFIPDDKIYRTYQAIQRLSKRERGKQSKNED